jgi:FkbM family methyltransferase
MIKYLRAGIRLAERYAELSRGYPEIANKMELVQDDVIGRFPRRLKIRVTRSNLVFTSSGNIPLLSIYKEIFKDKCYFGDDKEEEYLTPGKIVIDIGANVGFFSIFAALSGCRVFAIEANPCAFQYLLENIKRNNLENIFPFNYAISNANDVSELFLAEQASGSSLIGSQSIGHKHSVLVRTRRLQSLLNEIGNHDIDLLKIDCEGGEYEILFGAESETLERINKIVLEYHEGVESYCSADILDFLQRNGYKVSIERGSDRYGFVQAKR